MEMRVMIIGSGAREHTLAWKLVQSPKVSEIFVAPGNAGTAEIGQNLAISQTDILGLVEIAKKRKIELVIVGPEGALDMGITDEMIKAGIPTFGPTKAATIIESSKVFSRELMEIYDIACPAGVSFSHYEEAIKLVEKLPQPPVIKADGLAAGKGVVVCKTRAEALGVLHKFMVENVLPGGSGKRVLIEERLSGKEASVMGFTDGKTVVPLVPACDYKRAYDGDKGPNTGGMGSYSPPEFMGAALMQEAVGILKRAVAAMEKEGRPYQGVIYGGLMVTDGALKTLEFNARFGDPETQVVLPRLKNDLLDIILAVISGNLDKVKVEWSNEACVGVVMASKGYPGDYSRSLGSPISGLNEVDEDVLVFHAGTKEMPDGSIITDGGRVLTVVAKGKTLAEARKRVYDNVSRIHFKGCHYRKDIAKEVIL